MNNELEPETIELSYFVVSLMENDEQLLPVLLDQNEKQRYQFFKSNDKKREFLAGRLLLKVSLAYYLDRPFNRIKLATTPQGKPYLGGDSDLEKRIRFNLSHSHGLVVCVFGLDREMGIDVERMDGRIDDVSESLFSPGERRALAETVDEERRRLAYQIWTRKEAWIKADGSGMTKDLKTLCVIEDLDTYYHTMEILPGYMLSVAVKNGGNHPPSVRIQDGAGLIAERGLS